MCVTSVVGVDGSHSSGSADPISLDLKQAPTYIINDLKLLYTVTVRDIVNDMKEAIRSWASGSPDVEDVDDDDDDLPLLKSVSCDNIAEEGEGGFDVLSPLSPEMMSRVRAMTGESGDSSLSFDLDDEAYLPKVRLSRRSSTESNISTSSRGSMGTTPRTKVRI